MTKKQTATIEQPSLDELNPRSHLAPQYRPGFTKDLDQRTKFARFMREGMKSIANDLGGESVLSYLQLAMIEEAIWTQARLRDLRHRISQGERDLDGTYSVLLNAFAGLANKLGLKRKARTLSLDDYAEQLKDRPTEITQETQSPADPTNPTNGGSGS